MEREDSVQNDPELDGKYLGTITSDFVKVADLLKEASYQIKVRGFSDFPIFPVSKTEQPIGQLLYGKDIMELNWNYYASFLEEFIERKIIDPDKTGDFMHSYKNIDEFCCLFVIDKNFTNFVYIPYPID